MFCDLISGDNILTAVSVARECSMIGRKDRVIQVQASPPAGDRAAQIEWICHDLPNAAESETTDVDTDIHVVCIVLGQQKLDIRSVLAPLSDYLRP